MVEEGFETRMARHLETYGTHIQNHSQIEESRYLLEKCSFPSKTVSCPPEVVFCHIRKYLDGSRST